MNTLARLCVLASLLVLASCRMPSANPGYAEVVFPPPPSGIAPQPYTAEQIRTSNPAGTYAEYLVDQKGMATIVQTFQWTAVGAAACELVTTSADAGGAGAPRSVPSQPTWHELRDHASFPAALTIRTEEMVQTPAGRFACWRYDVRQPQTGDQPVIERYWFDKNTAGSPVQVTIEQGREQLLKMVLISTNRVAFR